MALQAKVGSITAPGSTGNQSYTGIGFQPKAVIFFGNGSTADGSGGSATSDTQQPLYLGLTDGTANAALSDDDDFTNGDPFQDNGVCIRQGYANGSAGAPTQRITAHAVSLDADGFTLNWTAVGGGAVVINYLALGGTDITGAKLVTGTAPTATGSWGITGAGFAPDTALILVGSNVSGNPESAGFGFVSKTGPGQGAASSSFKTNASDVYERTNQAIVGVRGATKSFEAALTSFDTDGMTLNVTTRGTYTTAPIYAVLFLQGAQFKSGSLTQKTSTGTQATTGVGFQPSALLLGSVLKTAGTTLVANGVNWMFGATDGTNQASVAKVSNTHANRRLDRTKVYTAIGDAGTGAAVAAAAISSFDTDGFTLNYTTADATAREMLFLAVGPAAGGGSALTQNVDDSVTMSDATVFGPGLGLADSATMSDAVAFSPGLGLADSVTMSESVSLGPGLSLSDSVTPADAISLGPGLGLSDSVTMSDALSMGVGLGLADTLVLADALAMGLGLSLADAVTLADSVNEQLNGGGVALTQNIDDTVTLADALAFGVGLGISDNVALADALAFGLGLGLADAVALADAISKSPGLSLGDSVTTSDSTSFGIGLGVNDALPLVDALMSSAGLSLNDALTLADHVSFLLNGQPFPQTVKAHVRSYFITKFGFYT